jgi:hypothetical protein
MRRSTLRGRAHPAPPSRAHLLPPPPQSAADDPLLHNPLQRAERCSTNWFGVVVDEGVVVESTLEVHKEAWRLVAIEMNLPVPLGSALNRIKGMRDDMVRAAGGGGHATGRGRRLRAQAPRAAGMLLGGAAAVGVGKAGGGGGPVACQGAGVLECSGSGVRACVQELLLKPPCPSPADHHAAADVDAQPPERRRDRQAQGGDLRWPHERAAACGGARRARVPGDAAELQRERRGKGQEGCGRGLPVWG